MNSDMHNEIVEIRRLIDKVNEKIQPALSGLDKLDRYQKELQLLKKRIQYFNQKGEEIHDELKSQKIKLVLKIDEIESAISDAHELFELGKYLKEKFKEYDTNSNRKTKNLQIINKFNGVEEHCFSASKAYKLFNEKVKKTELNELVKIINEICSFQNGEKLYVLHGRMISINDFGFHESFFKQIDTGLATVLRFNKTAKKKFTISEMLEFYVNYTLNGNSENK